MLRAIAKLDPASRIGLAFLTLLVTATGVSGPQEGKSPTGIAAFPRLTVWAWENPEDLRALDPQRYAVAYLDQTIFIGHVISDDPRCGAANTRKAGNAAGPESEPCATAGGLAPYVSSRPRLQRLLVSPQTRIIAVVRIEAGASGAALNAPGLPAQVASLILHSAQKPRTAMLQIDFDATRSERAFYTDLLREVKNKLPVGMPLSITALASWCADDDWISGLPVDEAVPMFFRMGIDRRPSDLPGWTYPLREPRCEASAGVSADEPWPALREDERVYIFHPGSWTPAAIASLEAMVTP